MTYTPFCWPSFITLWIKGTWGNSNIGLRYLFIFFIPRVNFALFIQRRKSNQIVTINATQKDTCYSLGINSVCQDASSNGLISSVSSIWKISKLSSQRRCFRAEQLWNTLWVISFELFRPIFRQVLSHLGGRQHRTENCVLRFFYFLRSSEANKIKFHWS